MKDQTKIKYVLYARKSSESEEKQVQSIGDQLDKLRGLAQDKGLRVVKIFKESKSAKQPYNRPVFMEMLKFIKEGKADGILCWQINRLSRNSIDSGEIKWLLQEETIKSIQTYDRDFRPEDNGLLFSIESGMAEQFIQELKKNTRRGLESKVKTGWCPYRAPAGYMNDKLEKIIVKDPERFELIKNTWELVIDGAYSPLQVLKILNQKWGYLSRKTKHSGGHKMSQSEFYRILNNPFYYGQFKYNGELYKGKHEPMITINQFEAVQKILGNKIKPRKHKKDFAFTGIIVCGHCGCQITAEEKTKLIKSEKVNRSYTYYRCTRRKNDVHCEQPPITLSDLEDQIVEEIEKFTIHKNFKDWSLKAIKYINEKEINDRVHKYQSLENKYRELQKQLDNLTEMRIRELIDDEEFIERKNKINTDITKTRFNLDQNQDRGQKWIEVVDKAFNFAVHARQAFIDGDNRMKRDILSALGQNYILKDRKLNIQPVEWLIPLYENKEAINKRFSTLELKKNPTKQYKNTSLEKEMSLWGAQRELNPH